MRERITFVHGSDDAFDPKQLDLQDNVLNVKSLRAAREDRLTLGLYDLPQEVQHHASWTLPESLTDLALASTETESRAAYSVGFGLANSVNSAFRF